MIISNRFHILMYLEAVTASKL